MRRLLAGRDADNIEPEVRTSMPRSERRRGASAATIETIKRDILGLDAHVHSEEDEW